ncbi:lysophospholipid acyltransferase family protein [Candidatus Leptofilum sp.]|uniref:lysophospholipid acyltransferase family protein n=1 Tax=Candidatus Leptofilum sp. TaxID=3241576 RepID=UPI003B5C1639
MSFIRGYYRLSLSALILVFFAVLIVLASFLPISIKNVPLSLRLAQAMVRSILWILNVRVICEEKEKVVGFDGFFFPNHVSYLEVLALYGVMPTRFLAKAEVRDWPLVGPIAAAVGCVFVQRGDKQSRQEARQELTQVETFPPITIFPEGKRGPSQELLPFRYGAFEIVTQGSFAFLPIAATFNHLEIAIWHRKENILAALWRLASQPERIEINLQPLAAHHPTPDDDPVKLAEKVHGELTAVLFPNQLQDSR